MRWLRTIIILFVLFLLNWALPSGAVDPWNLFNLKKLTMIIFALVLIQAAGSVLIAVLGHKAGTVFGGVIGGMISSTATTVSLARNSMDHVNIPPHGEYMTFLSATLGMLIEASVIVFLGADALRLDHQLIFLGPAVALITMIVIEARASQPQEALHVHEQEIKVLQLLKLAAFILTILAVSRALQNTLGNSGLVALTFVVSLFEIHGAVISNMQLHDTGVLSTRLLSGLLAVSVLATYVSKLLLVTVLGSPLLLKKVARATVLLMLALALSWLMFFVITLQG